MRSVRWIVATIASLIAWLPGQASWAQQTDSGITQTAAQAVTQAASQAAMQATTQAATQVAIQATAQAGAPAASLTAAPVSTQAPSQNTLSGASSGPAGETTASLGTVMSPSQLDTYRGGSETFNTMQVNGTLQNTTATNVYTGSNSVTDGSFANSSGLPTVIQNSGANVLIQNATILNVQFKQ